MPQRNDAFTVFILARNIRVLESTNHNCGFAHEFALFSANGKCVEVAHGVLSPVCRCRLWSALVIIFHLPAPSKRAVRASEMSHLRSQNGSNAPLTTASDHDSLRRCLVDFANRRSKKPLAGALSSLSCAECFYCHKIYANISLRSCFVIGFWVGCWQSGGSSSVYAAVYMVEARYSAATIVVVLLNAVVDGSNICATNFGLYID